ncbi:FecCD family ABC transporter permease [Entomohabitans teleogrylli]|uniref:FecCD family ABC transporter permease n=1 Tax=Entomohabitans teleogrylli TaxID=1384589 RepID=UPI00073D1FCB|nr:iron ABC transporter permease [Entomohabitans teleogrylli]
MNVNLRFAGVWIAAPLLLAGLMLAGVAYGSVALPFRAVLAAFGLSDAPLSPLQSSIILELRLPRVLLGALAGAGLALVGALLQTTTRNDLADPFLFGLSSGASVGAVWVITRSGDHFGVWTLPLAAFAGGIISAVTVMLLFMAQSRGGSARLIISGLAISFLFGALTHYLVFSGDQRAAGSVLFWSLGGLGLARWDSLGLAVCGVGILVALIALRWRQLDALLAGEQTAHSLGVNVTRLRGEVFLSCALATATLVALCGVIGFVGLMVPHLARVCGGIRHRRLLPLVALLGAILLCAGDLLSRTLIAPQELPVGIITGGLGGFFILTMLLRKNAL